MAKEKIIKEPETNISLNVEKAVIPIAGLGTRFLPFSKTVPKELWPLVDIPVIQYIVEEAIKSGIKEIIFVVSLDKKSIVNHFAPSLEIEKLLKERKKTQLLEEMQKFYDLTKDVKISYVLQKQPKGDGHAILQAAKNVEGEACGILFGDDVVDSSVPCLAQLLKIFKTCQRPVIAIRKVSKEKTPLYGILEVEKIANKLYRIKSIVEKPPLGQAPSELAITGKYVITPEVFDYLKKAKPSARGEIGLTETLGEMIKDGKTVYGYEFDGEWLECGTKPAWLKSHLYLSLKSPQYGPELKKYLKEII